MPADPRLQTASTVVRSDRDALALCLADHMAAWLESIIHEKGHAVLAVSGGSTPLRFFRALSATELPWERVTVTLVDDRAVPHDHPRSNTILVREHLLQHAAASARFVPLTAADGTPLDQLDLPGPVDLAHFGMGTDGHTASWFPGGSLLEAALSDIGPDRLPMQADGAPEPRITFTWAGLHQAAHGVLHFEGPAKAATYAQARRDGAITELPVRLLLRQSRVPLTVFTDTSPLETST